MKNNKNKGFTMIELLAVITIMGILTTVAAPAVFKYLTKAKNTSADTMLKSAYEAAEQYMMENNYAPSEVNTTKSISINTLVNDQYLEAIKDPTSGNLCNSNDNKVIIKRLPDTEGGLRNYSFQVELKCPQYGVIGKTTAEKTFPK